MAIFPEEQRRFILKREGGKIWVRRRVLANNDTEIRAEWLLVGSKLTHRQTVKELSRLSTAGTI